MLCHKISLNKCKKTDTIESIFSNHNEIKLETNRRGKTGKFPNTFLNNQSVKKGELEYLKTNENENSIPKAT